MLYVLFFLWVTVFVGCFFRTEVFYIKTVYDLSISNAKAIRFHSHTKVVSNIRFLIYPFRKNNVFFTLDVWRSCCFSCERCSPFILFASQCIGRNFNDIQIRIMCVLRIYPDKANEAIQAISLWYFQPHIFLSAALYTSHDIFIFIQYLDEEEKKSKFGWVCVPVFANRVGTTHKNKNTQRAIATNVCDVSNTVESI